MNAPTTLPVAAAIDNLRRELRLSYGDRAEFEVKVGGQVIGACSESAGDVVPEVDAVFVAVPNRAFAEPMFLHGV